MRRIKTHTLWKITLLMIALLLAWNGCVTTGSAPSEDSDTAQNKPSQTGPDNNQQNTITSVDIQGDQVIVHSNNQLTYTSVKHIVPSPGVVFYFPDTILDQINDITSTGSDRIQSIVARQQDINGPYSKIEITLAGDSAYNTTQKGNELYVAFSSEETETVDQTPEDKPQEHVVDLETKEPNPADKEPATPSARFSVETTSFSRNALIQVHAGSAIEEYKSSVIPDPPKIVFDLYNVQSPDRNMTFSVSNNPFVKEVRTFRYPKRLRMVIDTVPEYITAFRAYPADEGLSIYVGLDLPGADEQIVQASQKMEIPAIPASPMTETTPILAAAPIPEPDVQVPQDVQPVQDIPQIQEPQGTLSLQDVQASQRIQPAIAPMPDTPVVTPEPDFQTIFNPPKPQMRQEIIPETMAPENTAQLQQAVPTPQLSSSFSEWNAPTSMAQYSTLAQSISFSQPSTMLESYANKGAQKNYTGEKIAIDFYETDIKNVFRILREVSGQNFAIDSDVSGKVTLTLKKPVPWDQILDLILKMNKLGITHETDIIRISQLSTINKEQEEFIAKIESEIKAAKKREELLEPILTHYIPVNYARAVDLTKHLEKVSTKDRGSISVDERTNTIIISDVKDKIQRALSVVHNLDKPNLQVMIETRIIEVTTNFSRDIGVNWNGTVGIQPGDAAAGIGPQRGYDVLGGTYGYNWAVNYPAASNSNIGINFTRLSGLTQFTLDAQLSAMESKGEIRILTSPRIVALDNKEASIEQGLEYPINTLDEKGNTITEFKDVDLDLKVTPHITQDGRVSMLIDTSKNDLGPVVNGKQSFQKKQAKTELLVNDGDTVVIGGIMKTVRNTSESGVPLLSKLPMVGWLFSTHSKSDDKEELIIFITPKIIKLENKALVKKLN
ncbi:MAG: type IV pilus secretin PilQ [Candidatus Magnetomorum sp.]|nr:type IV pilus secretin PilQ [Candidatus Magnetomorum sp.]